MDAKPKYAYHTVKISEESRQVLDEVVRDGVYSRINVKDLIAMAWPRCPKCGGVLVIKFASKNVICARCKAEYELKHVD
jgi:ssDNA-binding Zn-finger/Zn-ribbon topoisomerase 1